MDFALNMNLWGIDENADNGIHAQSSMDDEVRYEFDSKIYNTWYHMMNLARKDPEHNVICEDWKNYNKFCEFYSKNYYTVGNEKMLLKKDIFNKDNIYYEPKQCVFVPYRISILLKSTANTNKEYPVGVSKSKTSDTYISTCAVIKNGKKTTITRNGFKTVEEAEQQYKKDRLEYIQNVANAYIYDIPESLYNAMMCWEV